MPLFVRNNFGPGVPVLKEYRNPVWLYSHMTVFSHVLGPLIMVGVLAICGAAFSSLAPTSGIYLLFVGILMIFHEFSWLFSKLACLQTDDWKGSCWRGFKWMDDWKRSLEYLFLGIIAFVIAGINFFGGWALWVGGSLILVASIMYFLKAIRYTRIEELRLPDADKTPNFTGQASAPPQQEWGTPGSRY